MRLGSQTVWLLRRAAIQSGKLALDSRLTKPVQDRPARQRCLQGRFENELSRHPSLRQRNPPLTTCMNTNRISRFFDLRYLALAVYGRQDDHLQSTVVNQPVRQWSLF